MSTITAVLAPSRWGPWLKFAALNTLRNRRRSAVTVTIAALGTAAILLAGGFALSTYQALAPDSALVAELFQRPDPTVGSVPEGLPSEEPDEDLAEEISQLIYHLQALMLARGLNPSDIYRYL